MSSLTLVIGNKNYSSWSLRPWLILKIAGIPFEEILIPLYQRDSKVNILVHSPAGRVPVLKSDETAIWDSLAIAEYLAGSFPDAGLWPSNVEARARARSVSAEMHSGFAALRDHMPMDLRNQSPGDGMGPGVADDIGRIIDIWTDCRHQFGGGGDFLFGRFSIADAMFAPVVGRFRTYGVDLPDVCQAYSDTIWSLPEMAEWVAAAHDEPYGIDWSEPDSPVGSELPVT